jgi:hypothetical protein
MVGFATKGASSVSTRKGFVIWHQFDFPLILYSIIDLHVFLVVIPFGCIHMNSSNLLDLFLKSK